MRCILSYALPWLIQLSCMSLQGNKNASGYSRAGKASRGACDTSDPRPKVTVV